LPAVYAVYGEHAIALYPLFNICYGIPNLAAKLMVGGSLKDISLENNEIKMLKNIRHQLATVDDMQDALTVIDRIIEENSNLSSDQVRIIRMKLTELGNRETILRKSYHDLERRFKMLGRIDSQRLERLQTELATVPDNLKRIKEEEIGIERRKLEYDKKIIDLKTRLDIDIKAFNDQMALAIRNIAQDRDRCVHCIRFAKEILTRLKKLVDAIRQLERELIDLNNTQKELLKGERRKR